MAINEDTSLSNRHTCVSAASGGGKSQAMYDIIPAKGIRAVFWDVDKDHDCLRFTDKKQFLLALSKAHKSGKPFRVGWSGDDDQDTFLWWCNAVWAVLDGRKDTYVVVEEAADLELGAGKAPLEFGRIIRRGRKYGAILVTCTQRCQEIPKQLLTQSSVVYIGMQAKHDANYLAKMFPIDPDTLPRVEPLHFYRIEKGEVSQVKVTYKHRNKSGQRGRRTRKKVA